MPSSLLFAINNEGRVFGLSTSRTKWREFVYLGLEFKHLSAVPHFMWAVGGDRQIYVHVHGLDIPIRIKEEAYENERWLPLEGFSGRLLPTDRFHYSSQDGSHDRSLDKIRLPSMAWQWEGDWHLETTLDGQPLDHDGWTYAVDFPATFHPKKQWKSCVRRRKWIRYRRYSALNSWCAIAPLHKDPTQEPFIGVAVGGQCVPGGNPSNLLVWAITAHGRVMFRTGVSTTAPEGLRWTSITVPPGCEVNQISIGPTGLVWAVLWNGRALVRAGVTRENPTGEFWLEVGAPEDLKLAHVSVGTNAVWAVTRDQRVWFRKGVRGESAGISEELARGSGWVEMVGSMAVVSVAANDQVFAVGSDDRCLYFRTGVLPSDLTGKKWRAINVPTQLSRAGSNASLWSANYRNSVSGGTPREKRVRSWSSLARNSCSGDAQNLIQDWEETSRSAPTPTSLRLQPAVWQRNSDGASLNIPRPSCSEDSVSESSGAGQLEKRFDEDTQSSQSSNEMINTSTLIQEHSEGAVTEIQPVFVVGKGGEVKKNPTVWSPIRSVGSIVGMEAHPESDGSVFDPVSGDSGVFGEEEDTEVIYWADGDMAWCMVEAGACTVDPLYPPNWFIEAHVVPEVELFKPWRVKILQELKKRLPEERSSFEKYEKAIEMSSWVKSGKAWCQLKNSNHQFEDCMLELEWVGSDRGRLDSGTLSVLSLDKKHTKMQFSLSEITCVVCCSEPSKPRIAIHTPKLTKDFSPIKLQFIGETDMEDWMANLTSVCCQMFGVHGSPSPGAIWITTGLGDVFVFDPAVLEVSQLSGEMYTQELDVAGKETPYDAHLHNGFPPGTILTVQGCVTDDCNRFSINLQCPSISQRHKNETDIMLHFNPRFMEAVIVRNSMLCGEWGTEEKEGEMVFKQGTEFTIDIYCQDDCFKICVDGNLYTYYVHRQKPHNITHVGINGGVSLNKVIYQSKMVIIPPPDMFWRQMGGHLRKVETCSAGVTWGIGYDNTAWVYTGGWGGSFLKGLETSSSGINPMTDTHSYYVYENQRWNPLTGYTSHGLPTDRYMWSDVTGRHKRTREKTKLLSMHWQWVSDWSIDYHTPGGVDKEGWQYAIDFPATYHGQKHFTDYVRRRRWVRKAQLSTSGPWQELGNTKLVDISLQVSNKDDIDSLVDVWAVAANGDVVYRRGVSSSCPSGTSWEHVPSDHTLASISCGADKQVWAVGRNGSAYWRFGITTSNHIGEVWVTVEPPTGKTLKQISVGCCAVWGLDSSGQLSVRREVTPVFPEGTHWQTIPTTASDMGNHDKSSSSGKSSQNNAVGFRHVSAGPVQGEIWAITATGVVCRRHGVTPDNPAGTGWTHGIGGNWQYASARGCNIKPLESSCC
ncbi:tectonin beta-propeller repeat-containing protein isoform X6 [Zootermopsis nevadensis]|uniref:Tectonin beta-propeller repeat-containing protein n=1 Tax=Zootermopsis nevadensis TaxID=136037 RepID=A0A067QPE9_ZOONE|nr:tectonin beta-propeller repeat-containing protein isoform X6 [Zootermopsis nevadensis]KDR11313.1 Tectonin beta-propeller repeat-containing protein [Zootermopsis nevadensis]